MGYSNYALVVTFLEKVLGLCVFVFYAASVFSYAPCWWVFRFMLAVFLLCGSVWFFNLSFADVLGFMPTMFFLMRPPPHRASAYF